MGKDVVKNILYFDFFHADEEEVLDSLATASQNFFHFFFVQYILWGSKDCSVCSSRPFSSATELAVDLSGLGTYGDVTSFSLSLRF